MRFQACLGYLLVLGATACSGAASQSPLPVQPAYSVPASDGASWMDPRAKRVRRLLYVSDWKTNHVFVFDYRRGTLLGELAGFKNPYGQCVDKHGNVWIADYQASRVVEFSHGGSSPMQTLRTDGASIGCSIAPNGDLAVANFTADSTPSGSGDVKIFKHASGKPTSYSNAVCYYLFPPGFDDRGNLYVADTGASLISPICGIPSGTSSLVPIVVSGASFWHPGGIMWDGKRLAITIPAFDGYNVTAIYRARATSSGSLAVVGSTELTDSCYYDFAIVLAPFIVGARNTPVNHTRGSALVGGNQWCTGRFDYWQYPTGGNPLSSLNGSPLEPMGQSVSIAD
jgi:hypothetical protein